MRSIIKQRTIERSRGLLAARVLDLRTKQRLSQQALADHAGIDRKTVNRIENGHFSPSVETLLRICHVVKASPSQMLKGIK